jgi:predicted transcriptional regulator
VADSAAERNDLAELQGLRELQVLRRERKRLTVVSQIAEVSPLKAESRIDFLQKQISTLVEYLRSAGWEVTDEGDD